MLTKFNLLLTLLVANKKEHLPLFILSTLIVFIVASVLFISSSIYKELSYTLDDQADITIQKFRAGHVEDIPASYLNEYLDINGVNAAQGRVYGVHFYEPKETFFMIVGLDFYDPQITKKLAQLTNKLNVDDFLKRPSMIIGSGVKKFFDEYHYFHSYNFRPPDRSIQKVYIYDKLKESTNLVANDMIIMDINLARKILGIKDNYFSDIILKVTNSNEKEKIYEKLIMKHFDTRIITKEEIAQYYKKLYNYKGGIFLALYLVALMSFLTILYQRYTLTKSHELKEITLLRSFGYSIESILWLKILENALIAFIAYIVGVIIAFWYVFWLGAPLLKNIFLGDNNLPSPLTFITAVDYGTLGILFGIFIFPYLLSVVIPLWKMGIEEIGEVLR